MKHRLADRPSVFGCAPSASPIQLCDRLLTLARDADRAGYQTTADRLVVLAHHVLDEPLGQRA